MWHGIMGLLEEAAQFPSLEQRKRGEDAVERYNSLSHTVRLALGHDCLHTMAMESGK